MKHRTFLFLGSFFIPKIYGLKPELQKKIISNI